MANDTEHGSAVASMATPRMIYAAAVDAPAESEESKAFKRALNAEQSRFERRMSRGATPPNRNAQYGVGSKANPRRNGRLMNGTLTERDFTGRPTAAAQTSASAAKQWLDPRVDDGQRKRPQKRAQVYRRAR